MTTENIIKGSELLKSIKELEKSIKEGVELKVRVDWHLGCAVEPHRMAMLNALTNAKAAAAAVMESAARQQIKALKDELKALGVEVED